MKYILTLLMLISTAVYAKDTDFSIIIKKPFNDQLVDITEGPNREIYAVGFSKSYKAPSSGTARVYKSAFEYLDSVSSTNNSKIKLISVNRLAHVTLNSSIKLKSLNEAVSILKAQDNGYFIGGYTLDGSLSVQKVTEHGKIVFNKIFGTKNNDKMSSLISLRDGGVLAIGSSTTSRSKKDNIFETGLGLNDIYITRFSKNGQKLWSKKYGTKYDDKGISAAEAHDGSIIILSETTYDDKQDISLMRISETGDKIWIKEYKSDYKITPYKVIKLRDNNFIMLLSQQNDLYNEQIRIVKFNIQKNIIFDKEIETLYSSALMDIKEYSNGNLIGVGYTRDSYNTDGLVMSIDSNAKMLLQDHFGDENYDIFNAVTILHNSQIAIAGVCTDINSQESNMWLMKLNRDLTLAQIPTKSNNFYKDLLQLFKNEISSNQLVIKEDLSIDIVDKNLYFEKSQYKLSSDQKKFLDKLSKKLIKFLKANQDDVDTLEVNGHTSSEWGKASYSDKYLLNEELSMKRSFSTLSHMFKAEELSTQKWLADILKGSGLNSSKKIHFNNIEDRKRSRRVSFKIVLK